MINLLLLALIGFIEAIVFLFRYRTANDRSPWISALSTFCICTTRLCFVFLGAKAVIAESPLIWAIILYGGVATITTGVLHEYLERRKERKDKWLSLQWDAVSKENSKIKEKKDGYVQ